MAPPRAPHKRFCSERHQRIAEKRRYRQRHTEVASCKRCGKEFQRTTGSSEHKQVYCTTRCQYLGRRFSYRQRLDIQAGIRRAREARAWGATSDDLERDRRGGALELCADSGSRAEGGFR